MKCQECSAPITVDGVGSFCSVDCYGKAFTRAKVVSKQPKPIKVGNLVEYLDARRMVHTALVLAVKPKGFLQIKVYRTASPDRKLEVGPHQWRRRRHV